MHTQASDIANLHFVFYTGRHTEPTDGLLTQGNLMYSNTTIELRVGHSIFTYLVMVKTRPRDDLIRFLPLGKTRGIVIMMSVVVCQHFLVNTITRLNLIRS